MNLKPNYEGNPLVTVGILSYNNPVGLLRAVNSIISQDYLNLEILISDNDSSSFDVYELMSDLVQMESRIKVFKQPINIGMIPNFQYLSEVANGEYFMWASDDDAWSPNYISKCLEVLLATPDCVSVFCFYTHFNTNNNKALTTVTPTGFTTNSSFRRVIAGIDEMIPNKIYGLHKTTILRKVNFDTFDWFDVFIIIQMSYYGKMMIVPQYLYHVGIDGSIRKPYSLTGKYIQLGGFRKNMRKFISGKFSISKRLLLLATVYIKSIKSELRFRKILKSWVTE